MPKGNFILWAAAQYANPVRNTFWNTCEQWGQPDDRASIGGCVWMWGFSLRCSARVPAPGYRGA
jgi:hypothetical protein